MNKVMYLVMLNNDGLYFYKEIHNIFEYMINYNQIKYVYLSPINALAKIEELNSI